MERASHQVEDLNEASVVAHDNRWLSRATLWHLGVFNRLWTLTCFLLVKGTQVLLVVAHLLSTHILVAKDVED